MVDKQIKLLLHQHDCVVIPDFGGLIARYVSARIHPVKHTLVPPSKKIAFNEKLVLNDGLLISTIAHNRGVSQQEAAQQVAAFVFQAREKLKTENRFELQDIGVFRYNAAHRLEFEFVENENLLDASFGLPELLARPVVPEESKVMRTIKERQAQVAPAKLPMRKRLRRVYNVTAALFICGVAATGFYLLSLQTDYNLSSLNPVPFFEAGSFFNDSRSYNRFTPDYVPLTGEERAAIYQEVLPFTAAAAQETVPAWNSFAASLQPDAADFGEEAQDEVALYDGWDESVAAEVVTEAAEPEAVTAEVAVPVKVAAAPVIAPAATGATYIRKGKDGRAYVITGGYSSLENAEYSRKQIQKQGYEPAILLPGPGSRLYRVAVADYATEAEAHAVKRDYRKIFGETIWVLKN